MTTARRRLAAPESVGLSSGRLARLDAHFEERIRRREIPCAATLVSRKGRLVHASVQGMADIEHGTPLAPDTIHHIYSMSKPITAVALLMLMEEGVFHLDQPAADFLPEMAGMQVIASMDGDRPVLVPLARPISIRHLFTHTSGICYPAAGGTPAERLLAGVLGEKDFREPEMNLREWMTRLVRSPLAHQPGEGWTYGFSIDVLGRLVEVMAGTTFDRFLEERLFRPLGMADTFFAIPDAKLPRLAVVYADDGNGGLTVNAPASRAYGVKPAFFSGGGGLFSTAPDYLRFAQMLVNSGSLDGVRILGRATVDLMCRSHIPQLANLASVKDGTAFGQGCTFGLAGRVVVDESRGLNGSAGTYSWDGLAATTFFVDRREELTALFFTQVNPWPARLHEHFRTLVNQALT
jgi:CubicO group peptidase (beta-lactamase class C family)